jgi:enoyl-CoA hydratase/carnithine racemase
LVPALDLILTGRTITGRKARALGLADALVPDAGFDTRVGVLARGWIGSAAPQRRRGVGRWLLEANPLGRALVLGRARRQTRAKSWVPASPAARATASTPKRARSASSPCCR